MPSLDELLAPRLDPVPATWPASELRHAAVLAPLIALGGVDHLLFTVRPGTLRRHAGQIGFPGGMQSGVEDPRGAALRECEEEIGVPASAVTILGALRSRVSSSRILVQCLVARVQPVDLELDADEVERVLYVPVAELRDETRWAERPPPIRVSGTSPPASPHFRHGDDLVWGLTGRFVREFVERLAGGEVRT
ncbi:MAG: CoA pyrophosphatase [Planctomycetes bacterium]|nr:CoA pyrophosphatase [Planctomycetota bacterium]